MSKYQVYQVRMDKAQSSLDEINKAISQIDPSLTAAIDALEERQRILQSRVDANKKLLERYFL